MKTLSRFSPVVETSALFKGAVLLVILAISAVAPIAHGQTLNYQEDTDYRDDKFPFSMFYPKDWIKVAPSHAQTRLKVVSTSGRGYTDFNINVFFVKALQTSAPASHVKFLTGRQDLIDSMVKTGNPTARVLASGATYLNNREAFYVKSEATFRNLDNEVDLVVYQLISLREGNVYTLTFRSAKEDFEGDFPTFKAMAASFTVRPTKMAATAAPVPAPTQKASPDSSFVRVDLPFDISLEVPRTWWLLDGGTDASVGDRYKSGTKVTSVALPKAATVNLFRANSTPRSTYAGIAVNATASGLDASMLMNATASEIAEISEGMEAEFKKDFAEQGIQLLAFYGVHREMVGRHPALVTEYKRGGALLDLRRFLVEKEFRGEYLEGVSDDSVRYLWENEFPIISGKPQASILIRLDAFLRQKLIRNIVCQKDNKLNFRAMMDHKKIVLIKLSQGTIGIENSHLLGTLLLSKIHQIALSRQDTTDRPFWAVYVDEFHNFVVPSIEGILSGIRKFNISLALIHQEYRQLQSRSQDVAASVMSNCYTRICFRLGDADADRFADGFSKFDARALQDLGVGEAVARVECADYDFNLRTFDVTALHAGEAEERRRSIVESSRRRYATPRDEVEAVVTLARPAPKDARDRRPPVPEVTPERGASGIERASPADRDPANRKEHQYLQTMLKRIGEKFGYVGSIEEEVFGGAGRSDVALVNGEFRIACEVAVTNTVAYEISNIQKCLSSGFDAVAVVSPSAVHLNEIRLQAGEVLAADRASRVHFLEPGNFHIFLESLAAESPVAVGAEAAKVKGYKVESSFGELSEREITDLVESIRRLLGADGGER